jgi:putative MATE family efflux protein
LGSSQPFSEPNKFDSIPASHFTIACHFIICIDSVSAYTGTALGSWHSTEIFMSTNALENKRALMLGGPIVPTLFKLTFPVIAVIVAQTFVAILEAYWVSRLGTDAVAGVSLVLPLLILMNTMSNGGIGGGVSSAVARAIGADRQDDADALLLHAVLIALAFGLVFVIGAFVLAPQLYAALGGHGPTLRFALAYSAWVFGGAPLIWTVNLLGSALRGAGEVKLPAIVSLTGALILVPLSPLLIFGPGPFPRLGVGGAGAATLIFYAVGLLAYLRHLLRGRGALRLRRMALSARHFRAILGVGLISAFGSLVSSLTVVGVTGAVGTLGSGALAGYGIASRVDSLLVPLLFGLGTGVVSLIGVATGAGDVGRGNHIARIACTIAFVSTESLGALLATFPLSWMHLFTSDPNAVIAGSTYLRSVAPFYGFFGVGVMLYFASQGRSNMLWPFVAGALRLAVTVGGAAWLARTGAPLAWIVAPVAAGSVLFGVINVVGFSRTARPPAVSRWGR